MTDQTNEPSMLNHRQMPDVLERRDGGGGCQVVIWTEADDRTAHEVCNACLDEAHGAKLAGRTRFRKRRTHE